MSKRKKMKRNKGRSKGVGTNMPDEFEEAFAAVVELTDAFCEQYLDEDYRQLCEEMAVVICLRELPSQRDKPAGWAGGIVHALGWVNFLHDPNRSPYITPAQLAEGFSISKGTMMTKSRIIRDKLDITTLDPDWCTPAMLVDNPLVWMFDVGGFIMDIRDTPRQVQEEAYRQGLIPFIPADKQEPEPESGTGIKIIEFPSKQSETSRPKTPQKLKDDGPNLFDGLEE